MNREDFVKKWKGVTVTAKNRTEYLSDHPEWFKYFMYKRH